MLNAMQTLWTTVMGFALANALGVAVGSSRWLYRALFPLLVGFNSIPKVAVVPVLVVWFGIGTVPAVITAFLISFFPILSNVATGIATVEPELNDVLRALGASKPVILWKVGLPRAMPLYFASLKVAITSSFLGSIIAETIAGQLGIGSLMVLAFEPFRYAADFCRTLRDGMYERRDVYDCLARGTAHHRFGQIAHGSVVSTSDTNCTRERQLCKLCNPQRAQVLTISADDLQTKGKAVRAKACGQCHCGNAEERPGNAERVVAGPFDPFGCFACRGYRQDRVEAIQIIAELLTQLGL